MASPFIGDIRMFGGSFVWRNYALADGALLEISQHQDIFALFGTIYGGDGRTTVGLPDMRGKAPVHQGHGAGLSQTPIGQKVGFETVTLTTSEVPSHTHSLQGDDANGTQPSPVGHVLAELPAGANGYTATAPDTDMATEALAAAGGGQGHENMQPFLTINFLVALTGVFPAQS